MLVLAIDSAGVGCGVCVWRDGGVLARQEEAMERGQDARLVPMIMDVLARTRVPSGQDGAIMTALRLGA